jgi:hypothetical protein
MIFFSKEISETGGRPAAGRSSGGSTLRKSRLPFRGIAIGVCGVFAVVVSPAFSQPASNESPIADLQSVLGIHVAPESSNAKAMGPPSRSLAKAVRQGPKFSAQRGIPANYLVYSSVVFRMPRGAYLEAITARSIAKKSPGVFVLDPALRSAELPAEFPDGADLDEMVGQQAMRTPLVSHLAGAGFAVAFPSADMLNPDWKIPLPGWAALLEKFASAKYIDRESVFLLATHEYAELAFRLAATVSLAGVIIEQPRDLMFRDGWETSNPPADSAPAKSSLPSPNTGPDAADLTPEIARRYAVLCRQLKSPLLLIVEKDSPHTTLNKQTLLPILSGTKTDFSVALVNHSARKKDQPLQATPASRRASKVAERFIYDDEALEQWIARMLNFCHQHAKTKPEALPLPAPRAPGVPKNDDLFTNSALERMKEMSGSGDGDGE